MGPAHRHALCAPPRCHSPQVLQCDLGSLWCRKTPEITRSVPVLVAWLMPATAEPNSGWRKAPGALQSCRNACSGRDNTAQQVAPGRSGLVCDVWKWGRGVWSWAELDASHSCSDYRFQLGNTSGFCRWTTASISSSQPCVKTNSPAPALQTRGEGSHTKNGFSPLTLKENFPVDDPARREGRGKPEIRTNSLKRGGRNPPVLTAFITPRVSKLTAVGARSCWVLRGSQGGGRAPPHASPPCVWPGWWPPVAFGHGGPSTSPRHTGAQLCRGRGSGEIGFGGSDKTRFRVRGAAKCRSCRGGLLSKDPL